MAKEKSKNNEEKLIEFQKYICGYVMPIADTANYKPGHWSDVTNILDEVCNDLKFKDYKLVSNMQEVNVIHANIVNNLYNNDIVICDVSSKNPNVMFELGMRIAFDKPVVIIKDDDTDYCFDTGTIEHITYPKELRYENINNFKIKLSEKITETLKKHINNSEESPILKRFGLNVDKRTLAQFPDLQPDDIFKTEVLSQLASLTRKINSITSSTSNYKEGISFKSRPIIIYIDMEDIRKHFKIYNRSDDEVIRHFIDQIVIKHGFQIRAKEVVKGTLPIYFNSERESNTFCNLLDKLGINYIPF